MTDPIVPPAADPGLGEPADPGQIPERRPWLERIGLAAIALVMGALLSVMGIAAWMGGEWILAATQRRNASVPSFRWRSEPFVRRRRQLRVNRANAGLTVDVIGEGAT